MVRANLPSYIDELRLPASQVGEIDPSTIRCHPKTQPPIAQYVLRVMFEVPFSTPREDIDRALLKIDEVASGHEGIAEEEGLILRGCASPCHVSGLRYERELSLVLNPGN